MSTDFNANVTELKTNEGKLLDSRAKVARFCYEEQALEGNSDADVFGVNAYNYNNQQNIPYGSPNILQMSETVLSKGLRSQGSSFTRMGVNHFWGRVSYNVNKLAKHLNDFLAYFKAYLKEGDNMWSPTTTYEINDLVYMISRTISGLISKRTFICLAPCTNIPPLNAQGIIVNTSYWREISGDFESSVHIRGTLYAENDTTIEKNLNVGGDLIVQGSTLITDEKVVNTESDYVVVRHNKTTPLTSGKKAGMVITNYTTNKNAFIGVGSDGTFRVSDNEQESTNTYLNISKFGSDYFQGLTQIPATVADGAIIISDVDELENTVLNNDTYYHKFNTLWCEVHYTNDVLWFDSDNPVEDTSLIAILEASTKYTLLYFRRLGILTVSDNENQPILTRQEENDLANDDILRWDSVNRRAKGGLTVADIAATSVGYKFVNSSIITGTNLSTGIVLHLYFTADITGSSIDTKLTFNYNNVNYAVKVLKSGTLADVEAVLDNSVYKFIQANTALSVMFDGTYFVVIENPVVLNIEGNDIRADGSLAHEAIGTISTLYSTNIPANYLPCNGEDTTNTDYELQVHYPWLYKLLGNSNVLPDLKTFVQDPFVNYTVPSVTAASTTPNVYYTFTATEDCYVQFSNKWSGSADSSKGVCLSKTGVDSTIFYKKFFSGYGNGNGATDVPAFISDPVCVRKGDSIFYKWVSYNSLAALTPEIKVWTRATPNQVNYIIRAR